MTRTGTVVLPTPFTVQLPAEVRNYLDRIVRDYAKTLLVGPKLTAGKVVVELHEMPVGGVTHVVRVLYTADFDAKSKQNLVAGMYGKDPEIGYWESWMVVCAGRLVEGGFEISAAEVYTHRDGGWQHVLDALTKTKPTERWTTDGDVWPEPAGEPPANKGIICTTGIDQFAQLQDYVNQMVAAGARQVQDEVIVDMRDDTQRRLFRKYQRVYEGM